MKSKDMSVAAVARRVVTRVRRMSPKQRVKMLVDAGIIRKDGSLTQAYGGKPKP